ncbi:AraC family transcriptional regulator [Streptomonospora sp. S1-112]|uniref:AraC family transcriptional regulator n=1 Tax=Streptomonospora mangrovi TaxID=2883123 RepID=A0A9X3SFN3_9ACTN|nr:AraC family transcriptional regulator [Streptomonospora mangrovi]MDA0563144.1 AraC family transcriptional regulator [Streptomonospora mangrovi]
MDAPPPRHPLSVAHLAGRAGMSATSFHRGFKAATGTTSGVYHKRLRLTRPADGWRWAADTLSRIAASAGYASPSHESRDYKREFGAAPMTGAKRFG